MEEISEQIRTDIVIYEKKIETVMITFYCGFD